MEFSPLEELSKTKLKLSQCNGLERDMFSYRVMCHHIPSQLWRQSQHIHDAVRVAATQRTDTERFDWVLR